MSKRYTGGVVSSSLPTVNAAGASGVFLLSQQADAQSRNAWPPYKIEKSLRFRSAASGYLNRTPAVASNQKTFTISFWAKIGNLGTYRSFFSAGTANPPFVDISLQNTDEFMVDMSVTAGRVSPKTTALFRDPSAWYHFVVAFDTTQATQANRAKVYVNGVEQTLSALGVAQNTDLAVNSAVAHNLGRRAVASDSYHEGYMSEVYFIDGQALTPSSFGATDKDGNWSPIAYTGAYGTNGFYLNFKDNTSATTMGYDYSGNGNNWTLNGFNVSTANTTYDIMIDVPSDQDGASVRGNYPVFNAVSGYSGLPIINANIQTSAVPSGGDWYSRSTTMGFSSGKIYAEFSMPSITSGAQGSPIGFGIIPSTTDFSAAGQLVGDANRGYGFYCPDTSGSETPKKRVAGTSTSVGTASATITTDTFMVAFDLTNGNGWFGKNGTWYAGDPAAGTGASITGITAGEYIFGLSVYRDNTFTNNTAAINFGQRPFAYAPPSGFKSLNTFNLPEPTIKQPNKHFDTTLWTGNGTSQSIVNSGSIQPDFIWLKCRTTNYRNQLYDSIRGVTKAMFSDSVDAEGTYQGVTAFNANGFSLGAELGANASGDTFVGWQWRASNTTAVTNTAGSITSSVSASTTAGFSIVTYTGTGSNATVGHGLGVAPSMYIVKRRSNTGNWYVYHISIGNTNRLRLDETSASTAESAAWNNTSPTSTVFSIGTSVDVNAITNTYVAYCFAPIAGYSAFGSYTGNGSSDGPFIYTGFRPRFVIFKRTDTGGYNWNMYDTSRNTYNVMDLPLNPNTSNAESVSSANIFDFVSNGVKVRGTSVATNASGGTYIYMAFAENPFKYSRSR